MIILDTNVISETWKPSPYPSVLSWLNAQEIETLYLTVITVAEIRSGLALMPDGKRKSTYQSRFENQLLPSFKNRILPFDFSATKHYAALILKARRVGLAIGMADGYIASIALSNKFSVASRDVSPYKAAELKIINPWDS